MMITIVSYFIYVTTLQLQCHIALKPNRYVGPTKYYYFAEILIGQVNKYIEVKR